MRLAGLLELSLNLGLWIGKQARLLEIMRNGLVVSETVTATEGLKDESRPPVRVQFFRRRNLNRCVL
jgi:hypothetical protein